MCVKYLLIRCVHHHASTHTFNKNDEKMLIEIQRFRINKMLIFLMKNIKCFMTRCAHHHASTHTLTIVDQHVDHRAVIRRPFGLLYSKITATFLYRKMRMRMLFRFSHSRKTRPPSCTDELWPSSCTDPVLYPRPASGPVARANAAGSAARALSSAHLVESRHAHRF